MNTDNKEEIQEEINILRYKSSQYLKETEHKEYVNDSYAREARRLKLILEFIDLGFEVEREHHGLNIGKILIAWNKKKWRQKGKGKWYWYSKPSDFITKYGQGIYKSNKGDTK